ncbi:unnamed protein product [Cylicocyclus nassatus]|uniref:Uncharacterized protein n=1 Tax=Cylicocyclus nassatus TaxID=53992 RepID=A0AA36GQE7_CYLNA|nr:unnamed protein product [Cylicocyclus nassatus]CAJ0596409.1 unnamed protein product [Cylicocyclus nassatus]CAJ0596410.1 unnamed protein product [Cylicocyclus nassatus]
MSILSRISDTFHGVVDGLNNTFKVMNATVPAPAPLQSVNSGLEAGIKATTKFDNKVKDVAGAMYDNWIKPELDAKHPEYLGGNRIRLNVHEVTNTSQSEQDFLGDIGAKSATTDSHADFVRSFTEHGWLLGIAVARYDHLYSQSLPAKFSRVDKFSFYNPLFSEIGEQPVYDSEIYATTSSIEDHSVFGYQEGWASYRYAPNVVSGLMRPTSEGAFSTWTFADAYSTKPTLSAGWAREDPNIPNRVLAVTSDLSDQIFADFYFEAKWSRVMPMFSVPGAIGAF